MRLPWWCTQQTARKLVWEKVVLIVGGAALDVELQLQRQVLGAPLRQNYAPCMWVHQAVNNETSVLNSGLRECEIGRNGNNI